MRQQIVALRIGDVAIRTRHRRNRCLPSCGRRRRAASLCREAAGIAVKRRELDQAALTFNISSFAAASKHLYRVP